MKVKLNNKSRIILPEPDSGLMNMQKILRKTLDSVDHQKMTVNQRILKITNWDLDSDDELNLFFNSMTNGHKTLS